MVFSAYSKCRYLPTFEKKKPQIMKLKSFLLCAALGAVLNTATLANTPPVIEAKEVLNEFAESHLNSDANTLEKLLSSDVSMKFTRGKEILMQSQLSIVKVMRQTKLFYPYKCTGQQRRDACRESRLYL
jgi:hypothetical protein